MAPTGIWHLPIFFSRRKLLATLAQNYFATTNSDRLSVLNESLTWDR
jgi:hypothetical protein